MSNSIRRNLTVSSSRSQASQQKACFSLPAHISWRQVQKAKLLEQRLIEENKESVRTGRLSVIRLLILSK